MIYWSERLESPLEERKMKERDNNTIKESDD